MNYYQQEEYKKQSQEVLVEARLEQIYRISNETNLQNQLEKNLIEQEYCNELVMEQFYLISRKST